MSKVTGLTIGVGIDAKEFNKGIKQMERDIKSTSKVVGTLAESLKIDFDAGRFAQAQKKAQEAIKQTDEKARVLRDRLKYLEDTGAVDTAGYRRVQEELVNTEAKAVLLKRQLQEIKDLKIDQLASGFEKVGRSVSAAGRAMAPLSAAASAMLAAFGAIGLSTVKAADDLKTFADRVNLSAEELQKWQYIAMQTDVTNEELQAGLVKAQGAFGSLAKGDIDVASKALQDLGISAEQASQGMGTNFDELVNKLVSIQDPILQAAYANEIFGERMGAKLIPMLKAGGEGLAELAREFENFDTLTNEQIDSLAEFDNVMNKIKYSFKVIKDQLGLALLPLMQTLADLINTKIIPAVERLTGWFAALSVNQQKNILGAAAVVAALAPVLLITGKLISGIGGLIRVVGSLGKALTLLSANPILLVIGLVVGLLAVLYASNEEFRDSINNLISTVGNALLPIFETMFTALSGIVKALLPIIDLIANALIPIVNVLAVVFEKAFGIIAVVVEKVVEGIEWHINGVIKVINFLIRQINKVGEVFGFQIKELDNIVLRGEVKHSVEAEPSISGTVAAAGGQYHPTTVINNDYSDKDIKIEVIVQNYADEVDVDNLVRQINLKLAEEM